MVSSQAVSSGVESDATRFRLAPGRSWVYRFGAAGDREWPADLANGVEADRDDGAGDVVAGRELDALMRAAPTRQRTLSGVFASATGTRSSTADAPDWHDFERDAGLSSVSA